jgi:hypothetical protein
MSVVFMGLMSYQSALGAQAHESDRAITQLIIRYDAGAPPVNAQGRPWGAQCVRKRDQVLLNRGRWNGAGMRLLVLKEPVNSARAHRIARELSLCPYVLWAEPNSVLLGLS